MSNLSSREKRKIERLFGMSSGYIFDFSNRTFAEFVDDTCGRDIYDARYDYGSGSKANRLRGFWNFENNHLVGKLIGALIDYGQEINAFKNDGALPDECRKICTRLSQESPVTELDALSASGDERDFDAVAKQVREAIEKNEPENALDRLHTFVIKYVRNLCEGYGIAVPRDKPLHSIFGEYVKRLREDGHLESEMAARILKSNISVMEAFNDVRNNQSLAHDNPTLNYEESLLIFNHVAGSIRFLRSLDARIEKGQPTPATETLDDDIPF